MRSSTETLIAEVRKLSNCVRSTDIPQRKLWEVADRLEELSKTIDNLKGLSKTWKRESEKQEHEWYNDCTSIDRFTEELDEIIGV